MDNEKIVKIANGGKASRGGWSSLGHRLLTKGEKFLGNNSNIVNPILAGTASNLVSKATGSHRAGRNMMRDLGNVTMAGGKTLNESLGRGAMGTSANDGFLTRGADFIMSPFSRRASLRRAERGNTYSGMNNSIMQGTFDQLKKKREQQKDFAKENLGKEYVEANNAIRYGGGDTSKVVDNFTPGVKGASAIPAAVSTFMKSPVAKNIGKTVGKGLAFGTAEGVAKRVAGGEEKPEATKNTVETKPLGH